MTQFGTGVYQRNCRPPNGAYISWIGSISRNKMAVIWIWCLSMALGKCFQMTTLLNAPQSSAYRWNDWIQRQRLRPLGVGGLGVSRGSETSRPPPLRVSTTFVKRVWNLFLRPLRGWGSGVSRGSDTSRPPWGSHFLFLSSLPSLLCFFVHACAPKRK